MSTRKSSKHVTKMPPAPGKPQLQDLLDVRRCLDFLDSRKTDEAKALCSAVLSRAPNLVFANNARGLIALQEGIFSEAEHYLRKAVTIDPGNAEYITNLANATLKLDRIDEAVRLYEQAIGIDKENRDARIGLAHALHEKNDPDASIAYFEDAVRREPNAPGPLSHLGRALIEAKRYDEAVATILKSLELDISFAPSHTALGEAFHAMKMYKEALESHKTSLLLDPQEVYAHNKIADTYLELRQYDQAHEHYQRIIEIAPKDPNSYIKLASSLFSTQDRYEEAMILFHKALELDPKHAMTYNNIGAIMHDHGEIVEAQDYFEKALELRPNYQTARHNYALGLLLHGRLKEGWAHHESRLIVKERAHVYRLIHKLFEIIPKWDGKSSLAGKYILLMHEQGFGDSIQFLRYVRFLQQQGARIAVHVKNPLHRLFQSFTPAVELILEKDPLPPCDYAYVLMSLPYALGTDTVADIPSFPSYLTADVILAAQWKEKIGRLSRNPAHLKVGIVWGGNPEHGNDRRRSIPMQKLKQIFTTPNVEFYSLQKGKPLDDLQTLHQDTTTIHDLGSDCNDFADTAAAISSLDLVISVDTSVVHLSGALGHPTWTLLAHTPDWRWLMEREDSPWYPSMRLFRQPAAGDWDSVMTRVQEQLIQLHATKK